MAKLATGKLPQPIEEGLGRRLWVKSRKEWTQALYTPFIVCLASGNLELDAFRHYIAQDVHFLRAFVKASVTVMDLICYSYFLHIID